MDGRVRRRGREAADDRHRHAARALPARGAHLPPALRRGVVDGDPVGRLSARAADQAAASRRRRAKYVAFTTLLAPEADARASATGVLDWPYVEGLRMDEAMHPLTLLAVGLYGECCRTRTARRCGWSCPGSTASRASSRSCEIRFVEKQPPTTWNRQAPNEYGFYSNVNPEVDHPRWSQATERRIGELGAARRCCSTATATRSRASTPAWTCARTSDWRRGKSSRPRASAKLAYRRARLVPLGAHRRARASRRLGANPIAEALNRLGFWR